MHFPSLGNELFNRRVLTLTSAFRSWPLVKNLGGTGKFLIKSLFVITVKKIVLVFSIIGNINFALHLCQRCRHLTTTQAAQTLNTINTYLLLTEFEVRTVSYGPSFFFPFDLWPKREVPGS